MRIAILASAAYVLAMVAANASIAFFGPWVSPINAFILIGFDLAMRDRLHLEFTAKQMAILIAVAGVATWALNAAPAQIAFASAASFVLAACADWAVFAKMRNFSWLKRANCSNAVGAAVDSVAFPTIAFGTFMPGIIALQFAAKVMGGAIWAWVLRK